MTAPLTDDDLAQIEAHLGRVRALRLAINVKAGRTAPFEDYAERLLAEVRRLRAVEKAVQAVLRLAGQHATAAYARGDSEERRRWLDLFITIERAGYPTETKEDER